MKKFLAFCAALVLGVCIFAGCTNESIYKVTFQVGDDVSGAPTEQKIVGGQLAVVPADPAKTGATFAGWFEDSTCLTAFDFSKPIEKDVVIYAKWETVASPTSANGSNANYRTMNYNNGNYANMSNQNGQGNYPATNLTNNSNSNNNTTTPSNTSSVNSTKSNANTTNNASSMNNVYTNNNANSMSNANTNGSVNNSSVSRTTSTSSASNITNGGSTNSNNALSATSNSTTANGSNFSNTSNMLNNSNLSNSSNLNTTSNSTTRGTNLANSTVNDVNGNANTTNDTSASNTFGATRSSRFGRRGILRDDPTRTGEISNMPLRRQVGPNGAVTTSEAIINEQNGVNSRYFVNYVNGTDSTREIVFAGDRLTKMYPSQAMIGKTFLGWYLDENYTIPYEEGMEISANINLYAKWSDADTSVVNSTNSANLTSTSSNLSTRNLSRANSNRNTTSNSSSNMTNGSSTSRRVA